ncbi:MAG: hypothetical protein ACJ0OY_00410 [Dehalococcoidia bacterium]
MKNNKHLFQFFFSLSMSLIPFLISGFSFIGFNQLSDKKESCMQIYDSSSFIQRSLAIVNDESQYLSGVLINDNKFGDLIITSSRRLDRNKMQNNLYDLSIDNLDSIYPLFGDYISNKNMGFFQFSTPAHISGLSLTNNKPAIGQIGYTATIVNGKFETYSGRYSNSITLDNGNLVHIYSGTVDIEFEGSPVIDKCGNLIGIIIEGSDRYFAISSLSPDILNNSFK